jgi:hypothetical protein
MFDLGDFAQCCACSRKVNLDVSEDHPVTEDGNALRRPACFFGGERSRG